MADGAGAAFVLRKNGDRIIADHVHVPCSDAGTLQWHLVGFLEKGTQHVERCFLGAETTHPDHRAVLFDGAWDVDPSGDDHERC